MPKYHIQRRILYLSSLIIFSVVALSILLAYFYFQNQQEQKFIAVNNSSADNQSDYIEQLLKAADNIALHVSFNTQIIDAFATPEIETDNINENYFTDNISLKKSLYESLLPYVINYDIINRICLFNGRGDFIYTGKALNELTAQKLYDSDHYESLKSALKSNNNKPLFMFHKNDLMKVLHQNDEGYVTLIRPILDTRATFGQGVMYGICELQIPISNFKISPELMKDKDYTLILNNQIILEDNNIEDYSEDLFSTSRIITDYNNFESKIDVLNRNTSTIGTSFLLFVLIIATLIGLLLFFLERLVILRATNPLVKLCNEIQLQSISDKTQKIDTNELDEVGTLYNSFNNMLERLQNTVEELVAARTGKVEAQMLALQSQVNPHFIHNTLAIISSLAEEGNVEKVEEITDKLSSLIRYSSDFSHKEKLLSEELDYIEDYLDLLKERFEDDFSYSIEGRDAAGNIEVPMFILQPLIENAMNHSLKFSDYPWRIDIKALANQKYWRIIIKDNGAGISDEKIDELKTKVSQISNSSVEELMKKIKIGGFSLFNSMLRLYLMFPGNTFFDVCRNEENGTTITIGANIKNEN
jgi:sensor histidine kinase YesM